MRTLVFLFLVLFLSACKKDSPSTVLPIKFQRGMSVDSAKKLVESAGWQRDTELQYPDGYLELRFKDLRFPNDRDSFSADLLFINNRLFDAGMSAEPRVKVGPRFVIERIHTLQEYDELVRVMETVYGPLRNRRSSIRMIKPYYRSSETVLDTVYITDWDTTKNGDPELSAVMLNRNGLSFVAN